MLLASFGETRNTHIFSHNRQCAIANQEEIRKTIEQNLKADWRIERISRVSLALLKLAIFEIQYQNLPYKAIINEVVELAKKYGEDTSPNFVNRGIGECCKREKQ